MIVMVTVIDNIAALFVRESSLTIKIAVEYFY